MLTIDLDGFQWFTPKPKSPLVITIPSLERIRFNPKLLEQLPSHIAIGISPDGRQLAIREKEDGYKLLKSGNIMHRELVERITALGVRLPARYAVAEKENCWLASLEKQAPLSVNTHKITKTPRRKSLSGLQAELERRL